VKQNNTNITLDSLKAILQWLTECWLWVSFDGTTERPEQ